MECTEERSSYKDESRMVLWDKVKHVKKEIESGYAYRSYCCKLITNKTDINRSKERFDKSKDELSNILNQTAEILNPSDEKLISSNPQTKKKRLRSSTSVSNKEACIIYQSSECTLHKVAFKRTGEKMVEVAKGVRGVRWGCGWGKKNLKKNIIHIEVIAYFIIFPWKLLLL